MSNQSESSRAPLIELRHVDKHFGDLHVLKDVSLSVGKGGRYSTNPA